MQDIFETTGLKPGSVYLAFENKEALYKEALEQYANRAIQHIHKTIAASRNPNHGICTILTQMTNEATQEPYVGCFLVNSQLELAATNHNLFNFARRQLQIIEAQYATYLQPEVGADVAKERATSIMFHIFGLRVYGHHDKNKEILLASFQEGLPWLPWHT